MVVTSGSSFIVLCVVIDLCLTSFPCCVEVSFEVSGVCLPVSVCMVLV